MKNLFLLSCLLPVQFCFSQGIQTPFFTGPAGMSAYSNRFTDCFSQLSNQAALAAQRRFSAGVLVENKFLLPELNQFSAAIAIPAGNGAAGITGSWFGNNTYNESCIGIAYGKNLGRIGIGIRFNYTMIRIAGYGSIAAMGVSAGSIWQVTPKLCTGIELVNPAGGKFGKGSRETLPAVYKTGFGYEVSEKLLLVTEVIKTEDQPVNLHAGFQYIIVDRLITRFGITTETGSPYFGVGWKWKGVQADVLAGYHAQLGITPGLMLIYSGEK